MDATYNVFECKIKLFHSVFSLNYVMISTSNKIRNEYPASIGSLVFFLHSICLARAQTNEPAANLLHQSRQIEIDAAGSRPGFRQKKSKACRKHVESMSQTRTNLSKTWLQTWSKTRFAARFTAG